MRKVGGLQSVVGVSHLSRNRSPVVHNGPCERTLRLRKIGRKFGLVVPVGRKRRYFTYREAVPQEEVYAPVNNFKKSVIVIKASTSHVNSSHITIIMGSVLSFVEKETAPPSNGGVPVSLAASTVTYFLLVSLACVGGIKFYGC